VAPRGGERPLTIGAVLKAVAEEFPDISVSKIRFLEAEGLLTPSRTASGYRTYAVSDVERLRYVLRAQRDRFWPLKVIRDSLDAMDRGLEVADDSAAARPAVPAAVEDPDLPAAAALRPGRSLRLTPRELCEAAGIGADLLADLEKFGLLAPDATGHYGEPALGIARAAAGLAAHGVEARHLRAFRTAADREIGLVDQILAAERGDLAEKQADLLRRCLALHAALVRAGLDRRG
jgi:DNA-binding transcriptional MerR regulator